MLLIKPTVFWRCCCRRDRCLRSLKSLTKTKNKGPQANKMWELLAQRTSLKTSFFRALSQVSEIARGPSVTLMLHETIRNDDFKRNTALQHCCDIVSNGCNTGTTLQCSDALLRYKSSLWIVPCNITLRQECRILPYGESVTYLSYRSLLLG